MRELVQVLLEALRAGRQVAYCRLVETRGSTPQKAGAAMLVFADGKQFGTLGGGCVEAEVKRRALDIIAVGKPEIASFQLDDDYGWDDGLICGGRMQILIDPIKSDQDTDYFVELANQCEAAKGITEAIVFQSKNDLTPTGCYLFDSAGLLVAHRHATLVDGGPPSMIQQELDPLSSRPRAKAVSGVAYLPQLPRCELLIVGGGHIGQAVANLAPDLNFDVTVVDDREEYVTRERFPRAERLVAGKIGRVLRDLEISPDTYCLIVTRGHNHDEEALFHLVDRGARYVGMIGSKRKIKLIFDDLLQEGISPESLSRVYAPLGIDIGSQTVPEIAISILAELIAHRNLNGEVPGRPAPVVVGDLL